MKSFDEKNDPCSCGFEDFLLEDCEITEHSLTRTCRICNDVQSFFSIHQVEAFLKSGKSTGALIDFIGQVTKDLAARNITLRQMAERETE